jgi:hypothetical protein
MCGQGSVVGGPAGKGPGAGRERCGEVRLGGGLAMSRQRGPWPPWTLGLTKVIPPRYVRHLTPSTGHGTAHNKSSAHTSSASSSTGRAIMRSMCTDSFAHGFLYIALGFAAAGLSRSAFAQASAVDVAQGREVLNQGLDLRSSGDVAGALPKLKAAHALVHTPITGLELGRTYAALGKLVEARESFLSVARLPVQPEESDRSKLARAESKQLAEQLRSRIPSLTVKIEGVPASMVAVTVDGAVVPTEALDVPRLVDPGSHEILARSTSGGTAETSIDLKEGEKRDIELKIVFMGGTPRSPTAALAAATAASAPPDPSRIVDHGPTPASATSLVAPPARADASPTAEGKKVLSWSLIGSGAATGIVGAVLLGVEANNSKVADERQDPSAYNTSKTWWTVGLVSVVAGGVSLASGAVVVATSSESHLSNASHAVLWLGMGIGQLRLGGTW